MLVPIIVMLIKERNGPDALTEGDVRYINVRMEGKKSLEQLHIFASEMLPVVLRTPPRHHLSKYDHSFRMKLGVVFSRVSQLVISDCADKVDYSSLFVLTDLERLVEQFDGVMSAQSRTRDDDEVVVHPLAPTPTMNPLERLIKNAKITKW